MNTTYKFSGKPEEYRRALRQFTLDELLKCINKESVQLLYEDNQDHHAMKEVRIPTINLTTRQREFKEALISAWDLIDLAYNAICTTNDYRGKYPDANEVYMLCLETRAIMERREESIHDKIRQTPIFFFFLWGFAGEQFKMQRISSIFKIAARELYIILDLAKRKACNDYEAIILQETGVNWKVLISSLLLAWFAFLENDLEIMKSSIFWDKEFSENDFDRVIDRYTADYKEIRSSPLGRQIFYTKPYVRTQRGDILSINSYLNLCIYEHCILWIIREYYRKQNSGKFLNDFGALFESYFEELLERYVEKDQYTRILENKKDERADWVMSLLGYTFIIEQKSTIISLTAKQQETDFKNIEKFAIQTLIKALHQLRSTETSLQNNKCIKVILLYEDYLIPEVLNYVFDLPECDIINDQYYWIVTIDDMEKLLYLYKNDKDICKKIIEEKIQREENNAIDGKRLQIMFSKYGVNKNKHLEQKQIQHYENAALGFIRGRIQAK